MVQWLYCVFAIARAVLEHLYLVPPTIARFGIDLCVCLEYSREFAYVVEGTPSLQTLGNLKRPTVKSKVRVSYQQAPRVPAGRHDTEKRDEAVVWLGTMIGSQLNRVSKPLRGGLPVCVLLISYLPGAMGLRLTKGTETIGQPAYWVAIEWALPTIPVLIGIVRAYMVSRKPVANLSASGLWCYLDMASAVSFFVVQSVNESEILANLLIFGCWVCFWLVDTTTHYRLTPPHFRDRFLAVVTLGGACAAFVTSSLLVMLTGDLAVRLVALQAVNIWPLTWTMFVWAFYSLWRGTGRRDGGTPDRELGDIESQSLRIRARDPAEGCHLDDINARLEEQREPESEQDRLG